MTIAPGETRETVIYVTAPIEKAPISHGRMEIRRSIAGVYWMSDFIPLSLLPTMDWNYSVGGEKGTVFLTENRITAEMIKAKGGKITLDTTLSLADCGNATLKLVCANPLKAYLDGEKIIDCGERTIVIPAYHRADARKCAELPDGAGKYRLTVEIEDAEDFTEFYFFVVSPDLYWAYRLDSMYSI